MILIVAAFLAIGSPVFGMESATQEPQKRTITVIADLDETRSLRVYQEPIGRCGRGEFFSPPQGYQYDHKDHKLTFKVQLNEPQLYQFSISYTPFMTGFTSEEMEYIHSFSADVPGGHEDKTVEARLLSIQLSLGGLRKTIYKKD